MYTRYVEAGAIWILFAWMGQRWPQTVPAPHAASPHADTWMLVPSRTGSSAALKCARAGGVGQGPQHMDAGS